MIRGADSTSVEGAISSSNPFPGGRGFAGRLPDGRLVRDVLGRVPLYTERSSTEFTLGDDWSFDPTDLGEPQAVPAGAVVGPNGVNHVWSLPDPDPLPENEALAALRDGIEDSFDAIDTDGLAVAFSGGVDSALLATVLDAPLFTVGFPDSHDVETAREVASLLGVDVTIRALRVDELETAVPRVARTIDRTNAMDVQIALTLYFVARTAAAAGFDRIAFGQGADELFGGYAKIEALDHRVEADTVRGARREVLASLSDGLARDCHAITMAGIDPVFPYLDDRIVEAALRLPSSLIVHEGVRKRGLRAVAADHLPTSVVERDKKAMQYGSLVARELDRLARRAGFKRRIDDHVTQYVAARVADRSQNV